jgi:peptidoglycan/LPS O-acetylase OafA/YrhL
MTFIVATIILAVVLWYLHRTPADGAVAKPARSHHKKPEHVAARRPGLGHQ